MGHETSDDTIRHFFFAKLSIFSGYGLVLCGVASNTVQVRGCCVVVYWRVFFKGFVGLCGFFFRRLSLGFIRLRWVSLSVDGFDTCTKGFKRVLLGFCWIDICGFWCVSQFLRYGIACARAHPRFSLGTCVQIHCSNGSIESSKTKRTTWMRFGCNPSIESSITKRSTWMRFGCNPTQYHDVVMVPLRPIRK